EDGGEDGENGGGDPGRPGGETKRSGVHGWRVGKTERRRKTGYNTSRPTTPSRRSPAMTTRAKRSRGVVCSSMGQGAGGLLRSSSAQGVCSGKGCRVGG